MQLQGCMMQSLWLLWAQHGPATRSTTSLSTWPTTKDLAESGFGRVWVWQSCKVCLWPTACKAQQRLSCSVPYHAGEAGSCTGSCASSRSFPSPLCKKRRRHPPEKAPSLPAFIPALLIMSLQGELQSGPICFDLVTSVFLWEACWDNRYQ